MLLSENLKFMSYTDSPCPTVPWPSPTLTLVVPALQYLGLVPVLHWPSPTLP